MLLGFFLMGILPISIISLLLYMGFFAIRRKKGECVPFLRHFTRYLFVGCLLCLVYLTILWGGVTIEPPEYRLYNLHPFIWMHETYEMGGQAMVKQLVANIVMFLPYGLLLPLVFSSLRQWWKADSVVFFTSFFIELIQYFIGRSCDIDDLIMNTIGGCLGYGIFYLLNKYCSSHAWYQKILGSYQEL